jgi:hypothetical protein
MTRERSQAVTRSKWFPARAQIVKWLGGTVGWRWLPQR